MTSDSPRTPRPTIGQRLRRLFRVQPRTRAELTDILRDAERNNLLDNDLLTMIEGAMQVSEMQVRDIMVPRSQMIAVEEGVDPREFLPTVIDSGHSRFPVVNDRKDQVVGILLAKDLLAYLAQANGERFQLKDVLRPAVFVPESKRLNVLLREFRTSRNHLAVVVDEYGSVAGLVSIEDVIEQIVGEIDDEHDIDHENYIKPHGASRFTVKARTPIADFNEYFQTDFSDAEFDTIGGLVLREFGHLPKKGERLEYRGFSFLVLRADRRRIHSLRVLRYQTSNSAEEKSARQS